MAEIHVFTLISQVQVNSVTEDMEMCLSPLVWIVAAQKKKEEEVRKKQSICECVY